MIIFGIADRLRGPARAKVGGVTRPLPIAAGRAPLRERVREEEEEKDDTKVSCFWDRRERRTTLRNNFVREGAVREDRGNDARERCQR